ncbi:unnamed protein product [Caenorhabditis brenneri]
MPSLSKMENPATFPLLHLPQVALDEVISMMVPFQFVTIHGSKMNWELASTQDFSKNKAIDSDSRDFQLQQIKEVYEYINRILNFSLKKVSYILDFLISDHKSVIDWLKSQQESVEELYISSAPSYGNDLEYLLRNVKATKFLSLKAENKMHFEWDELFPKNLYELYLETSTGISLQQLLRLNNPKITLRNSKLTCREINLFLKSWMASESNLNLEFFKVYIRNVNLWDTIVNLPHQRVRYENGKRHGNKIVYGGIEIKQNSGKTGVMGTDTDGDGPRIF